ncbi:Rv3235 family protein [Actinoplanes sp. NPDC049265]|uniref:Rv3235 family protein n=1 Tax=Actinoplanes sp. NPDC049265 TaxID=3363902 RepID=UPI003723FCF3
MEVAREAWFSEANVGKRKVWWRDMTTVEMAPPGPRPQIRVRSLPSCDPPYDDELEPRRWETANQLALDWPAPSRTRQPPPTPAAEQLTRKVAAAKVTAGTAGDAKLAVRLFAQMFVEVLNGYRPAAHLARMAVPREATNVVSEAVSGTNRVSALRGDAGPTGGPRLRRQVVSDRRQVVTGARPAYRVGDAPAPGAGQPPSVNSSGTGQPPGIGSSGSGRPPSVNSSGTGRPSSVGTTPVPGISHASGGSHAALGDGMGSIGGREHGGVHRGGCTPPANGSPEVRAVRVMSGSRPAQSAGPASPRAGQAARGPGRVTPGAERGAARPTPGAESGVGRAAAMRELPRRRGAVDVLKFHFCEPRPGAVEATVLLLTGERTCALALRMELQGRRWMAAAVRLL